MIAVIVISCLIAFAYLRNEFVFAILTRTGVAVHDYYCDQIMYGGVDDNFEIYDHIMPYSKCFFRVWDWGYSNVLPEEDFIKVVPYFRTEVM